MFGILAVGAHIVVNDTVKLLSECSVNSGNASDIHIVPVIRHYICKLADVVSSWLVENRDSINVAIETCTRLGRNAREYGKMYIVFIYIVVDHILHDIILQLADNVFSNLRLRYPA